MAGYSGCYIGRALPIRQGGEWGRKHYWDSESHERQQLMTTMFAVLFSFSVSFSAGVSIPEAKTAKEKICKVQVAIKAGRLQRRIEAFYKPTGHTCSRGAAACRCVLHVTDTYFSPAVDAPSYCAARDILAAGLDAIKVCETKTSFPNS